MIPHRVLAGQMPNYSSQCADIFLVFARGSGQNPNHELIDDPLNPNFKDYEPESYAFFSRFKEQLDRQYPHVNYKAVSVHHMGYDSVGYQAVAVGTIPGIPIPIPTANTRNAEISALPGDYRQSVEHGINETVGFLKDQIASCPNQSIIVGGYSQGAQVMGDSLFKLTPEERAHILGVGFFGDPKYIGAKHSEFNPFSSHDSYPWRRGDALNTDTGMLDPRDPYIPSDMANKTASYCFRVDLVCAGYTGVRGKQDTAHAHYGEEPMRNTVNELMQWAAPTLGQTERANGGFDTTLEDTSTPPPDEKKRNIMFLLNDDSWLGYAIGEFRYDTDIVMSPISKRFPNTYYAVKGFGEGDEWGTVLPRVNNAQSFLPYMGYDPARPMDTTSNLYNTFASRYPFGQPGGGGGDWPDPHGLAVERAAFDGGWQADAEKHIVLITDRAPKTTYSYNICHASVRSWLQIPNTDGNDACYVNAGATDIWPKVQHPEICETVYKAILQDQCKSPLNTSTRTFFINRSLEDAIIVAQSQHVAVDIVVPHKVTDQYHPENVTKMQADLEYLAKATGGKFIYYNQRDQFDRATYTDMMLQIFGHKPKDITIAYKEALDGRDAFNQSHVLGVHTNQPVILDVSQSNNVRYTNYKWDYNGDGVWDETTSGPVVEHTFTSPQTGFVRIAAANDNDSAVAETHVAVNITPADEPISPLPPTIPGITAQAQPDGSIKLMWQSSEEGSLVVLDPTDHLYLSSALLSSNELTIPAGTYNGATLEIRTLSDQAGSSAQILSIAPVVVEEPAPVSVDEPSDPQQTDTPPTPDNGDEIPPTEEIPPPIQGYPGTSEQLNDQIPIVQRPTDDTNSAQDPTLCYKLQQCLSESHPGEQLTVQTVAASPSINQTNSTPTDAPRLTNTPRQIQQTTQVEGISDTKPETPPVTSRPTVDEKMENGSSQNTVVWILILFTVLVGSLSLPYVKRK